MYQPASYLSVSLLGLPNAARQRNWYVSLDKVSDLGWSLVDGFPISSDDYLLDRDALSGHLDRCLDKFCKLTAAGHFHPDDLHFFDRVVPEDLDQFIEPCSIV